MLHGFEHHTHELTDDEKRLLPAFIAGLKNKIGEENAITNAQIQKAFLESPAWQVKIPDARVRKIISYIRVKGLVYGLCASQKGYYVAKTKSDLTNYLETWRIRIASQIAVYEALKKDHDKWNNDQQ
jgi:hypothetical protein